MAAISPVDLSNTLHCHTPWASRKRSTHGPNEPHHPMPECCTYRGWTLINAANGWRYAVHGSERLRVCREHTDNNAALHEFRAKVDAYEDAR